VAEKIPESVTESGGAGGSLASEQSEQRQAATRRSSKRQWSHAVSGKKRKKMRGGDYLGHEVMGCALRLGQKGDLGCVKRKEKGERRLCRKKNQWAGFNF
jgi:hypothetical protein